MRIAIVHDTITEADGPDGQDVLVQAVAVSAALTGLGHEVAQFCCGLNLAALEHQLRSRQVELVFNLVESINGHGSLIHLLPFCLDAIGIAYTGCPAESLLTTSNKVMAKHRMRAAGIPTPRWIEDSLSRIEITGPATDWIIKAVWEHASLGIDASNLLRDHDDDAARSLLPQFARRMNRPCFAEQYIEGREFNFSLLAGAHGPELLPPAEIVFEGFLPEMPRIVDYQAKWIEHSFAYRHTSRKTAFSMKDGSLIATLGRLALACWQQFSLSGYARVDFRVDQHGNPFVLEVNANPCLAPDAGFAAALAQAGISFQDAIARIVAASHDTIRETRGRR